MEKKERSIMLAVRIDYTTEGKTPDSELIASALVVRDQFPTIEEGVKVEHVEVWHNGDRIAESFADD